MNFKETLALRLKTYTPEDIILTQHAHEQAIFRDITIDEIRQNILNPKRLTYAKKQTAENPHEEKYDSYFGYTPTYCHRYILAINRHCVVCTVIKINRTWQYIFKHNEKL